MYITPALRRSFPSEVSKCFRIVVLLHITQVPSIQRHSFCVFTQFFFGEASVFYIERPQFLALVHYGVNGEKWNGIAFAFPYDFLDITGHVEIDLEHCFDQLWLRFSDLYLFLSFKDQICPLRLDGQQYCFSHPVHRPSSLRIQISNAHEQPARHQR